MCILCVKSESYRFGNKKQEQGIVKEQKVSEINAGLDSVPMRLTVYSVTVRDKGIDALIVP